MLSEPTHFHCEYLFKNSTGCIGRAIQETIGTVARMVHAASEDEFPADRERESLASTRLDEVRAGAKIDGGCVRLWVVDLNDPAARSAYRAPLGSLLKRTTSRLEAWVREDEPNRELAGFNRSLSDGSGGVCLELSVRGFDAAQ